LYRSQGNWIWSSALVPYHPIAEQTIATAELCLEQCAIRAKCFADCGHVNLEGIFLNNRTWPDAIHEVALGDEFTG
jgi:hypothetical protein